MTDFEIVPMHAQHVAAIAALERICFSDPWSENSIRSELSNPLSLWLAAESDGVLIGYIGSQSVLGEADMMNVAVAPAARRQGVARALVEQLIGRLSERNVTSLALEVRVSNDAARALYDSLGFVPVGRRKNYYVNPKEDALILHKTWGGNAK